MRIELWPAWARQLHTVALAAAVSVACAPQPGEEAVDDASGRANAAAQDRPIEITLEGLGGLLYAIFWLAPTGGLRMAPERLSMKDIPAEARDAHEKLFEQAFSRDALAAPLAGASGGTLTASKLMGVMSLLEGLAADPSASRRFGGTVDFAVKVFQTIKLSGQYPDEDACLVARVLGTNEFVQPVQHSYPYYGAYKIKAADNVKSSLALSPVVAAAWDGFKYLAVTVYTMSVAIGKCAGVNRMHEKFCKPVTVTPHEMCALDGSLELIGEGFKEGLLSQQLGSWMLHNVNLVGLAVHLFLLNGPELVEMGTEYIEHCSGPQFFVGRADRCDQVQDGQPLGPFREAGGN